MDRLYTAIGLMSGTSMDGIDAAIIETDGKGHVSQRTAICVPYDGAMRAAIERSLEEAQQIVDRAQRPGSLQSTEAEITLAHANAVNELLASAELKPEEIDVVGFHGQTILHRPEQALTVQLGDGQMLSDKVGIKVIADFRAADMVAGGEGAPLAPAYHRAVADALDLPKPSAFINIGGISNITWIGEGNTILAFDIGPGNVLLDEWTLEKTGKPVDKDGALAARGRVDTTVLAALLDDPYFERRPPKSLDRKDYSLDQVHGLSIEDGAATLCAFTAEAIARSANLCPAAPTLWVICGGGRRNPSLMAHLHERLPGVVHKCEAFGLHGDELEAEAFAYLAVRSCRQLPLTFPETTGTREPVTGGILFQPGQAA